MKVKLNKTTIAALSNIILERLLDHSKPSEHDKNINILYNVNVDHLHEEIIIHIDKKLGNNE
jgi:hypothetical protein